MNKRQRAALEKSGWKFGDAEDFLNDTQSSEFCPPTDRRSPMPSSQENDGDDVQRILVVPSDRRDEVKTLVRRHLVARIAHECCVNRYRNASNAGDFEVALSEFDAGLEAELDRKNATEAFWACLEEIFPELAGNRDDWQYNQVDVTLERQESSSLMDMLSGLAK